MKDTNTNQNLFGKKSGGKSHVQLAMEEMERQLTNNQKNINVAQKRYKSETPTEDADFNDSLLVGNVGSHVVKDKHEVQVERGNHLDVRELYLDLTTIAPDNEEQQRIKKYNLRKDLLQDDTLSVHAEPKRVKGIAIEKNLDLKIAQALDAKMTLNDKEKEVIIRQSEHAKEQTTAIHKNDVVARTKQNPQEYKNLYQELMDGEHLVLAEQRDFVARNGEETLQDESISRMSVDVNGELHNGTPQEPTENVEFPSEAPTAKADDETPPKQLITTSEIVVTERFPKGKPLNEKYIDFIAEYHEIHHPYHDRYCGIEPYHAEVLGRVEDALEPLEDSPADEPFPNNRDKNTLANASKLKVIVYAIATGLAMMGEILTMNTVMKNIYNMSSLKMFFVSFVPVAASIFIGIGVMKPLKDFFQQRRHVNGKKYVRWYMMAFALLCGIFFFSGTLNGFVSGQKGLQAKHAALSQKVSRLESSLFMLSPSSSAYASQEAELQKASSDLTALEEEMEKGAPLLVRIVQYLCLALMGIMMMGISGFLEARTMLEYQAISLRKQMHKTQKSYTDRLAIYHRTKEDFFAVLRLVKESRALRSQLLYLKMRQNGTTSSKNIL